MPSRKRHAPGNGPCVLGEASADSGVSQRALFVIDAAGTIRWSYLSPMGVNPGADGILAALERLTPDQRGAKATASASASSASASAASASSASATSAAKASAQSSPGSDAGAVR